MICANCGTENRPGRKFCGGCGQPLALVCPACGAANEPGMRFCGECGTPIADVATGAAGHGPGATGAGQPVAAHPGPAQAGPGAAGQGPASPLAPEPVAERRLVSVLFADLVGFTPFAEGRDAEDVRDTLSRYFDLARDVIGRYGGTVEKFIGDAVMAVWGAPVAREDDAERAVRAALDLVDAVRSLAPAIQARAAVLTGEAAVTLGATNQGMVAGDLVNTASRLQSVAPPGAVFAGEATMRAASGAIAFESAEDQVLKGKAAPVPAWRALRVVAERGGRNRSDTLEAPFVGRDDELRLLKDLFHATARERRARLVSVVGPAGIGKSRLAWEFLKYVDGLVETVWWHDGRSPSYGEGITFWALGEMVRERCRLRETDDERTTRRKVAETLAEYVPDADERRWIEPAVLVLLGIERGAGSEHLFGAWRTFFERLAGTAPVVLVFEDFHFADPGLLDFVDHVMEWSRNVPIYVVTLSRPELMDRRPDWGAGKRNFTSLYLEPLSEPAMRALLGGLVPGLPEAAVRAIVARADGVPLYAVETVRMLLAQGRLEIDEGVYRPVGDVGTLAVPETLTALIASRLDGLTAEDRALVNDAAVLGQSFTLPGLAAVSGSTQDQLEPRLRGLVRRELFAIEADPRSPEHGQYSFVQALIREVAYNTLAKRDRKVRHLAAARFFEALGTDELAGALAGHYLAAHANAAEGAEADALAAQARVSLRAAADRAAALGSFEQALMFHEQALRVTTDPTERTDLLERAGIAAMQSGRHDAAERHLRDAVEEQRRLGSPLRLARATAALGSALLAAYRMPEAIAALEPTAAELEELAAEPDVIALNGQLARSYFMASEQRRAIDWCDRVLETAEHANLGPIVADTLITKGTALALVGRAMEGLALVSGGLRLAESLGLGETLTRAHINRSFIESNTDPRAAFETAKAGMALARRMGQRSTARLLLGNAAGAGMRAGEWAWGLAGLDAELSDDVEGPDRAALLEPFAFRAYRGESVDGLLDDLRRIAEAQGDSTTLSLVRSASAVAAFAGGRLEDARTGWREAAKLNPSNVTEHAPKAARASLWLRDAPGAADDLALLDATMIHGPAIDADRTVLRAGILAVDGRSDEALAVYRDALRAWRNLGLVWDEALAGLDMAQLLDPADPEVASAARASRAIFERLGAGPFLARLDAAAGRETEPVPE